MSLAVDVSFRRDAFDLQAAFSCDRGLTALFGRSGAGKTTLVNLIAGLEKPQSGRISIDGRVLVDCAAGLFVPPHQRRIGYVFQEGRLFPHLSVARNLRFGRWFNKGDDGIAVDHVVELLGIRHLLERRPGNLSGGEKQRVAIGRALLSRPQLLLMDEPLASLDAPRKDEILPYLERLRDELQMPIVYVSHAIPEVTRLADTVVLLSDGKVQAVGSIADLSSRLDLFPLTGRYEAGAVLDAAIASHDERYGLTRLHSAAGELFVPLLAQPPGSQIRIRIRARDVTLALSAPEDTSALNILRGAVAEVKADGGPQMEVRLDCGGQALLARVTRLSADKLQLAPGRPVYAMVKTVAIDGGAMGGARGKR